MSLESDHLKHLANEFGDYLESKRKSLSSKEQSSLINDDRNNCQIDITIMKNTMIDSFTLSDENLGNQLYNELASVIKKYKKFSKIEESKNNFDISKNNNNINLTQQSTDFELFYDSNELTKLKNEWNNIKKDSVKDFLAKTVKICN